MRGLILRWLTLTFAIMISAYLLDGIRVSGFFSALFAAALLGILNAFFRPIAMLITLPINILTLGLFTFVVNAFMLKSASAVIPGFEVHGFWTSIFGALLIGGVSWLLNVFISEEGQVEYIDLKYKGHNRWE
jgi:putative membrane protein